MRIFQDPPAEIDGTWTCGVLVGGMASAPDDLEIARAYRAAAKTLIGPALAGGEAWRFTYPILFLYRHALELYLKSIVRPSKLNHSLGPLLAAFEDLVLARYKQNVPCDLVADLRVFADMDAQSLRYSHDRTGHWNGLPGEYWVPLNTLAQNMDGLCDTLERIDRECREFRPFAS